MYKLLVVVGHKNYLREITFFATTIPSHLIEKTFTINVLASETVSKSKTQNFQPRINDNVTVILKKTLLKLFQKVEQLFVLYHL